MKALNLYKAFLMLESEKECEQFLKDLLTPNELKSIQERWRVAQLLMQKVPYRTISEKTGVSTATITRVARYLGEGKGYQTLLNRAYEDNHILSARMARSH